MVPKITIIIPTYNRAGIISRALDSLLEQTFMDWECLVVDDHSTDNTKDVIQGYSNNDPRIIYLVNSRKKGAQGARNTGLYKSESEWVMFLDSDNALYPECLQILLKEAKSDVIKCFSHIVDTNTGNTIDIEKGEAEGNIHKALFDGSIYIDFNHEIIRRGKMLEIGGLDEACTALQEFDTNIRLSKISNYHTVDRALIFYYQGGKDTISFNCKKQILGKYHILTKYKTEWLSDKRNADRMIFELIQKLKDVDSFPFKMHFALKIAFRFPEMLPYYLVKKMKR